ncbi:uncharacterized protein LOC127748919 [Frankliniella occidentalis]|uniref:Uncharacterized protein LOC127748919 n=1 Tax=Frankliniella occidentalis TaxID=133901 RepID=A0A9C6WVN2_FRAOC|nr:uncharacterized protein LOC127748919 [Frankliniella occidentalis]
MRDSGIGDKMAVGELKFEAPLAQFEEAEDWGSIEFSKTGGGGVGVLADLHDDVRNSNSPLHHNHHNNLLNGGTRSPEHLLLHQVDDNVIDNSTIVAVDNQQVDNAAQCRQHDNHTTNATTLLNGISVNGDGGEDNFLAESFSGSLEDLVNTFDDKITKCFCNFDESVEKLAPVQVRTQEEIMNECQ